MNECNLYKSEGFIINKLNHIVQDFVLCFSANVMKLVDSKKVGGILVININSTISQQNNFYFSPDRKCPNQHFGKWVYLPWGIDKKTP